jgi:hypothetical protein
MKKFLKTIFSAAALSVFMYSCAPDDSSTPASTPTDPKQKFVASWNCAENSKVHGSSSYTLHIVDSTGSYVRIESLYNVGFQYKVEATISSPNITIANQGLASGFTVYGSGTMVNNNTVNMTYYVNDGSTIDTCTAVLTK